MSLTLSTKVVLNASSQHTRPDQNDFSWYSEPEEIFEFEILLDQIHLDLKKIVYLNKHRFH